MGKPSFIFISLAMVAAICLASWKSGGEQVRAQEHPPGMTAAHEFENIQALKDLPANDLKPLMRTYEQSLGVGCTFCHLRDSASDDSKPQKRVARKMILMTAAINQGNFDGETRVTCYTCHRGNSKPETSVPDPPGLRKRGEVSLTLRQLPSANLR
jgi:hypothetical protein